MDVTCYLNNVFNLFIKGLKSSIVGGASLLQSTCKSWTKFVAAIAQLEWNLRGDTAKATTDLRPAGAHVVLNLGSGRHPRKRATSPGFLNQLMKF